MKSTRARTVRTEVFGLLDEQSWFLITELCMGSFKDIISSASSLKYVPEVMGNLLKLGKHTGVSWLHPGNTNKNVARGQDFCKDPQQPDSWMSGFF